MPRARLSTAGVVEVALAVIDEQGLEQLTLAAVAAHAGVATPSLYKHVASLAQLRNLVGVRVMEDMAEQLTLAVVGRSGDDAVASLMRASRAYVVRHPTRYAAMPADPLHDPATQAAGYKLLQVFLGALRAYRLDDAATIHATRCLRAITHGFTSIEAAGGFGLPEGLDDTYEQLIQMFIASLPRP
ncbi:TetR-like C-terminal domain-containing protein [Micromonospora sp. NPDC048999]|uniref:TetR/AcrR family transcriptional regulator n=1 Tax=Micromonospora sp. NPDC048999 TaxID=3155391 RepID=UPI0033D179D3